MKITRIGAIISGIALGTAAGAALQLNAVSASGASHNLPLVAPTAIASPAPGPSHGRGCPAIKLALAFTSNVVDTSTLDLHLPWGQPGDPEGQMVEDYGAYNGTTIRKHLPVHDVTAGSLVELSGHNAIDIVLDSGTPLYAVTSGTAYRITNWTIPGFPQGWASVVVSDVLKDDQGDPIAFLYGHVREFDAQNGQHVEAGRVFEQIVALQIHERQSCEAILLLLRDSFGRMARGYPDVRANTVASFALSDYEWILAFEADELHRIVDLMRDLRGSGARRHVREEVPFFTGRRRSISEIVATLP